jgi:hypothetical protein
MNFQLLIESLSEGFQFQIGVRPPSVWEEAKHRTDICPNGNFLCRFDLESQQCRLRCVVCVGGSF